MDQATHYTTPATVVPKTLGSYLRESPRTHPEWVSFFITLFLMTVQLCLIAPFFLINDDIFKILMVKGINASGHPSPFIGYSNIFLGYVLEVLYQWKKEIPWYPGFLCFSQFLSLWVFLWLLLKRTRAWFHAMLFAGVWMCVYFVFFVFLQFNMTSLLAAETALFIFFDMEDREPTPFSVALGWAAVGLTWLSVLIRPESLELGILLAIPLVISRCSDADWRRALRRGWFLPFLALAGVIALFLANNLWFEKDPSWEQYRKFDQARVELQDYRVPSYTPETKPLFDAAGWTWNDLWLFKNFYYSNPDKFNEPVLRRLAASFSHWGVSGKIASYHSLEELLEAEWSQRVLWVVLALILLGTSQARKWLALEILWTLILFTFLIYYLRAPVRVTLPALIFPLNWALLEAGPISFHQGKRWWEGLKALFLLGLLLVGLLACRNYYDQSRARIIAQAQVHDFLSRVQPRSDQLYEVWSFPLEALSAFDDMECLRPFHLFLTSFSQNCPASLEGLDRFGVKEPFRDAVDNPRVLMLLSGEEIPHYQQYLWETFHQKARAQLIFSCGAFNIYSVHSVKNG